eukprot:Hpha_TRINITY_DN14466_c0_g2::TRINITY_DN14466_c0_g2_i1::g.157262::m.157262
MRRHFLLLSVVHWTSAPWPEGALKDFPGQVWWEDWQESCADSRGSVYRLPVPPNDALGHYDTSRARCGYDCRPLSGNCKGNCGDLWCTGFSFDDWTIENSAHCPGTFCLDRPLPAPAPCNCQGPHHCSSWGDPHLVSFEGWRWDFPGAEEYEIFGLAGGLRVTSKNWKCNDGEATCMERVNLWADGWDGAMGKVNSGGGSAEVDKEGRLYIGCVQVNPRDLDGKMPYVIPGTQGQLVLQTFSRPDGEWVNSDFVFEYTAPSFGNVEVRVEAPIGKWTTSAYIKYEGCVCNVTGLCQGPLEIWDCYKGQGGDVPPGCGELPPQGDPTRKTGLCTDWSNKTQSGPPQSFPPRDCASRSVRKAFDHCCAKFSAGNCGQAGADQSGDLELPRTSFYDQCLWDNCQLNSDRTDTYCLGHVDAAAAQDKTGDCSPQPPSPTAPPEAYVPTPQPAGVPECVGEWSACDASCGRQWNWAPGSGVNCTTPEMPECSKGDGACPTPAPPAAHGTCDDGLRGGSESGVDCGGPCAKRCVECPPVEANSYIVDGTDCGPDESCAEVVLAAPQPPTGEVGCEAPCGMEEEYCEEGTVYLQRPGSLCGSAEAVLLSGAMKVYARGTGVSEAGGVGVMKSDVGKMTKRWDVISEGQPTVCYTPSSNAFTVAQLSTCSGLACTAEWRRDSSSVRTPNTPESFTPSKSLVEKKNAECVDNGTAGGKVGIDGGNGSFGCDLVVTVQDAAVDSSAKSTCASDDVCGFVDLLKAGTSCGSSEISDYVARGVPARTVEGRSDLRRAEVPSAMIRRTWGKSAADHVCWRARLGAAAKGVTPCRTAVDDCSQLEVQEEEEDGASVSPAATGALIALSVVAVVAVVALLMLKGKTKASPGAVVHTPPGMRDETTTAPYSEATSLTASPRRVVNVDVDAVI